MSVLFMLYVFPLVAVGIALMCALISASLRKAARRRGHEMLKPKDQKPPMKAWF